MLSLLLLPPSAVPATAPQADAAQVRPYQSLDLEVRHVPPVARIEGEDRLVYELHATNFSSRALAIRALEVLDTASGRARASIDPAQAMRRIGARRSGDAVSLAPGERAIFYISIPWPDGAPAPLVHRVTFDALREGQAPDSVAIVGGAVTPRAPLAAELGAPLAGGPWAAVALPEHDAGHRRYLYAVSGRVRIPGRHAIDWMPARGFDPRSAGRDVAADGSGAEVLTVADGEVVAARELPAPGARPSVEDETGAMIVLRLADDRYAHYQHLRPGLAVRPGMRVRRGQAIARLGATGHVTQPHLHFHIADGSGPLDSEGLPYRLGAGWIVGRYDDVAEGFQSRDWRPELRRPMDGLPAANAVVRFDAE